MIYSLGERTLVMNGDHHFVADNATLIGSVVLENNANIWFNAVIRADNTEIIIGEDTNIQDGAILHTDEGFPMHIGKGVTVGHKAMLHGCTIGDYSLIGINSVVLNGASIGKYCIIGANAMIKENMVIPDFSLVVGTPGKIIRTLDQSICAELEDSAAHYVAHFKHYQQHLIKIG